jgi:hypothetical protein
VDNLNANRNDYLTHMIIAETVRGGPARYRGTHQGTNPQAPLLYERGLQDRGRGEQAGAGGASTGMGAKPYRLLRVRLPRLPLLFIRLPRWAPFGTIVG